MSQVSRRALIAASAAVPIAALVEGAAKAATPHALTRTPTRTAPEPGGAAVADPDPVVDPVDEIGGTESASDHAVGTVRPDVAAAGVTSDVGDGAATRLSARSTAGADAAAGAAANAPAVPFSFRSTPFSVSTLTPASRPYALPTPIALTDTGVHDRTGVRMSLRNGRLYDHPVGQAQYGLALLESQRLTGRSSYLNRALLQAERLVARRVVRGNAWFYPYRFSFVLHRTQDLLPAPWYSMMAQGQALSLFVRLAEVTKEARWRQAANHTFASFLLPFAAGKPWGVYVKDSLLRLEEYPHPQQLWGDETYNGHVFATFGLYDYWVLTKDATALALLRGAMTTARDLVPRILVPNFRSHYCLRHLFDSGHYHTIHLQQQQMLQAITGDAAFARNADQLYAAYPPVSLGVPGWHSGRVVFARGRHAAYRFAPNGALLGSRVFTTNARTSAPARDRARIEGRPGLWYAVSAGALNGWWVQEAPGQRYMLGVQAFLTYPVSRPARVRVAHPVAVVVAGDGEVSSLRTSYSAGAAIRIDARAALNGVEHLRLATGTYRHRWIRSDLVQV